MKHNEPEIRALYDAITLAAHDAGLIVAKTKNTPANLGVKPELALAIALHGAAKRYGLKITIEMVAP